MRLLMVALLLTTTTFAFGDECGTAFRNAFQRPTPRVERIKMLTINAVKEQFGGERKSSRETIERLMDEAWQKAKTEAEAKAKPGEPIDPQAAMDAYLSKWEQELIDRSTKPKRPRGKPDSKDYYPSPHELLAYMVAKSNTFKGNLYDLLQNESGFSNRVFAHFMETALEKVTSTVGKKGLRVTKGKSVWFLWTTKIGLPARRLWTAEDMAAYMVEISDVVFMTQHSEPWWAHGLARAVIDVRRVFRDPSSLNIIKNFADYYVENYRQHWQEMMNGVSVESFGTVRPEVINDFGRWGILDTVQRRLAAAALGLKEGINEASKNSIQPKLTTITQKMLDRNLMFRKEVQQLSIELMLVSRPVIYALYTWFIYQTTTWFSPSTDPCDMSEETMAQIAQFDTRYVEGAADEMISGIEASIAEEMAIKKRSERELTQNPTPERAAVLNKRIKQADQKAKESALLLKREKEPLKCKEDRKKRYNQKK